MRTSAVLFVLLVGACSESFRPASAVTDLRAVAARTDIEGAPGRANPLPEEDIQVSWLVIDQGPVPPLQSSFIACIPAATLFGPPICAEPILPCEGCEGTPPDDPLPLPAVRFQVPSEAELEARSASSVVVLGAICADGTPSLESIEQFILGERDDIEPCEPLEPPPGEPEGRFVTVEIPIETDSADPNLHPQIADVKWRGLDWPAPYDQGVPRDAPRGGCLDALELLPPDEQEKHPVAGSSPFTINLSVTQESLQTFTVDDVDAREEIQVSWLSDGGDFETTFSFISDPRPDFPSIVTAWRPPVVEEEPRGVLVRFHFVIRDGRGGVDFVERGLCVRPPSDG